MWANIEHVQSYLSARYNSLLNRAQQKRFRLLYNFVNYLALSQFAILFLYYVITLLCASFTDSKI